MISQTLSAFETIKQINDHDQEFWNARDIMVPLGYTRWENFEVAISRAKESCKKSGQKVKNHFADVTKMVVLGSGSKRNLADYNLSRFACYLIAQNGDPRKEEIAQAQTYFAIQTRRQEVSDQLAEDQKRVYLRGEMTAHNKHLSEAASIAGVKNYGTFTNYGYMGLYGGMDAKTIHTKKKLKQSQQILDHMGSEELAANLFRTTQADAKLRREQIKGEAKANQAHFEVGKKVRQTIRELGGTMPEKLPTPDNLSKAKRRVIKQKVLKDLTVIGEQQANKIGVTEDQIESIVDSIRNSRK